MDFQISGFRIMGLHGRQNVTIEVKGNAIILVGVNGLGKTTIVNILYYFLTRQWGRLLDYQFTAVAVDINNQTISLNRDDIEEEMIQKDVRSTPRLPSWVSRQARFHLTSKVRDTLLSRNVSLARLRSLANETAMSHSQLVHLRETLLDEARQHDLFEEDSKLKEQDELLQKQMTSRVLYLPTYRRIERDLEAIFPGLEEEIHRGRERQRQTEAYVEFVEFGMRDVERRFDELFAGLKDRARSELNSLAASYLREVIRGEADTYDTSLIDSLDDDTITRILSRVEERNMLEDADKRTLREVIERLRAFSREERRADSHDLYVGHFFSKLADIHKSLAKAEGSVSAFVEVCNRYLQGKRLIFNDKDYTVYVEQESSGEKLNMRHLSSGEKQVVSLFTHVYLGEAEGLVVLIDEPELSLSVPWQRQLLPDILNSSSCNFLAAVTHSPYIFENNLDPNARDLRECIQDL